MARPAGSPNRGFFFRAGRGWYATFDDRMIPLRDGDGNHYRNKGTRAADIKAAHRRIIVEFGSEVNGRTDGAQRSAVASESQVTVEDVCLAYLAKAKADDSKSTHLMRADTLWDFCSGFPAKFRQKEGKPAPAKPKVSDRIHKGYGNLPISQLLPVHVDRWLNSHKGWKTGKRTRIQAVKRAMSYGVKSGLISDPPGNPLKGYKVPRAIPRVTYISPEQELAVYQVVKPAFKIALKVCIRTGVRPGSEFAKLTAKHVKEDGERMQWVFRVRDHKTGHQTGRQRIVWITDPEIIQITRQQIAEHPQGELFRNTKGDPWHRKSLESNFHRAKVRLQKKGIELDDDAVMYSCRHTYAKRVLQGHWTGKPTGIENLARLMGTSSQVCRDHYLTWTTEYEQVLWDCA
jgi:hypothetical protein